MLFLPCYSPQEKYLNSVCVIVSMYVFMYLRYVWQLNLKSRPQVSVDMCMTVMTEISHRTGRKWEHPKETSAWK